MKASDGHEPQPSWPSLPRRVEIAGGWIRISRPKLIDAGKNNADWDDVKRVIRVQRSLTNSAAWKYLFHELVHAWLDDSRMFISISPLDEAQEEAICEIISSGLHFRMRRELEEKQSGGST
jgi:Zn-dependent peptidase ImmA (M78 family)